MHLRAIEDVPLYQTSLRIMKFWSFLLQDNWRRYVCLIPYIMINTTQFLDIYHSEESIDAIVRNAYIAVLFFNTILRAVLLCINRFDYEKFMDKIRLLYIELTDSEDNVIRALVRDTTTAAKYIAKMNLLMGFCSCVGFVTYPIFTTSRVLPFGMYVPGIDKHESPFYEIFFVLQVIITPMGCCMYIPFTNIVVAFILFAILMCKVMQHKLKQLHDVKDEKAREVIIWCIKYQLQLINYVKTINELTTYTYLVEFLAFGAMLCAMLFLLIIVDTVGQMVIIGIYIFMIFSQSVIMYYYANELYDQSLFVAEAAYNSDWFHFNVMTQKILHLLILRAQKPCAILVGNIYPMNLEMLQSLLNTTYSYFTLLKRLYG
ncbi:odorant receptor 30a [Glossina fuscipes]|uniref:Odorant receptor n=2 Tax=Nemorhina TaxID=44051 RepID=A0A9C5ZDS5_9MUSC|nr:odorant receptor 30a [Glossina fuscipes]